MRLKKGDDSIHLDPVFRKFGRKVYSYDYIEELRSRNLELKRNGKRLYNLIPQKGFQEQVLLQSADIQVVGGKRGGGKVNPNDSLIVTPFGLKKLGDLKVGDTITDPVTGGPERVTRIYEHPNHDFYEMEFDDGVKCECGLEHLWKVKVHGEYRVCTFGEIKDLLDNRTTSDSHITIPMTEPVIFAESNPSEKPSSDPYVIGASLLDGHSIPDTYKYGTIEERFALVQGLMDMGGHVADDGKTVSFTTGSRQLTEDLRFVLCSLGASAKIVTGDGTYTVHIHIRQAERLFRLRQKRSMVTPCDEVSREIVGYRYTGRKDGRCITVNSPNRLYLLQDFIVTHNTWVGLFKFLPFIFNPDVNGFGFRKYEDDIARGIWKSSKQVFKGFGTNADSSFEWKFLNGRGATMRMEHLQDPKKISDRFRGVEMAYILIEELAEHTRDDMNTLFDLLASNRSTAGVQPICVCTCNPVGKSNKLRYFLDWYIDPETDTVIPERSGKVRYFYRYGEDVAEMAWGDSWEEVYAHPAAHSKIERICVDTGQYPKDLITSLVFVEGDFADNEILQVADPKYMNRIAARGGESTTNDIVGVWRDVDTGHSLLSTDDIEAFFVNQEHRDGVMRASADVALSGDFFVIYAFDGHHVCDMEAWTGVMSDDIVPFIEHFLTKNGVRKDNFTYDSNGMGMWIKADSRFRTARPFNN